MDYWHDHWNLIVIYRRSRLFSQYQDLDIVGLQLGWIRFITLLIKWPSFGHQKNKNKNKLYIYIYIYIEKKLHHLNYD
jgi:hypothetical protein